MNSDVAVQARTRFGPERETRDSVALVFPSSTGRPHTDATMKEHGSTVPIASNDRPL
jgi:hypothetical protein